MNPLNCPDGMTFAMWEENPFFDPTSLVLYGQNFGKKCLVCNGAYADVNTGKSCPGFCLWRDVSILIFKYSEEFSDFQIFKNAATNEILGMNVANKLVSLWVRGLSH